MKKIFAILAVALATLLAVSCNKEAQDDSAAQIAELVGTWKGHGPTVYINGEPANDVPFVLTFTESKITISVDGEAKTYSYTVGVNYEGSKYVTCDPQGDNFSFYYSVSGNTFTYISGNSSATLFWPKTFEKAVL